MRLIKYIAAAGITSRRKAEELIKAGRVTVGRELATDPAQEISATAKVKVDDKPVKIEDKAYFMVNKPLGVISTARDTHGRRKITDLVKGHGRLYPVGRLDADTTGLILLTNDGDLANVLTHPRYEVPKTYRVDVWQRLTGGELERLKKGIELDDGITAPAKVSIITQTQNNATLELIIREGRNRQVRRMMEALGHPVLGLQRVAFGPLKLGELPDGQSRELSPKELTSLRKLAASRQSGR